MRYDVFISCKSEDYESAKLIYKFLCEQSYRVFMADTELRKKGNAEYGKVIDEALDSAEHLILFTSRSEYVHRRMLRANGVYLLKRKGQEGNKGILYPY